MNYSIKMDGSEMILITQDGGIATFHQGDGVLLTTLFQSRPHRFDFTDEMWETLSDGKVYIKDYEGLTEPNQQVISETLEWLCLFCPKYVKVDWDVLINDYNQLADKQDTFEGILNARAVDDKYRATGMYRELSDVEKREFLYYVELMHHYDVDSSEDMQKQIHELLVYLNQ